MLMSVVNAFGASHFCASVCLVVKKVKTFEEYRFYKPSKQTDGNLLKNAVESTVTFQILCKVVFGEAGGTGESCFVYLTFLCNCDIYYMKLRV